MTSRTHKIALLGGDGIGPEVVREARALLEVYRAHGLPLELWDLDLGAFLDAIAREQPSVIFLPSPNNPTGNTFSHDRIAEIRVDGDGCSISQAAASMLTEVAQGRQLDDALGLVEHFRLVMHGDAQPDEDLLGDAVALEGVAKYPVRVKCASLAWHTLKAALAADDWR